MESDNFKVREINQGKTPRWKQYAALTMGDTHVPSLLKYELILLLCNNLPGALGIYLRSKLYPLFLGEVGKGVVFGRGVTFRHPHKIKIGEGVIIDDNCVLDAKGTDSSSIMLGEGVFIGRNTIIYCKNGNINLHPKVNIGVNCSLYAKGQLTIGKGTMIAAYTYIMNGGRYDYTSPIPLAEQNDYSNGTTDIGHNCWIGAKVVIFDGLSIGDSAVIGAGAVVTKDIPSNVIAMGVPAKVISHHKTSSAAPSPVI